MNKRLQFFVTCASLLLMVVAYVSVSIIKTVPSGDETISYLCSTGNQETYQRVIEKGSIYGVESSAAQWQEFLSNHDGDFKNIAADLVLTDLHPPLYFWLLHFFTLLPVPVFLSGMLFNFLLHLFSFFVIVRLTNQFKLNPLAQMFVMIAWCISPAIIGVGFYARQYELLGLMNILTASVFISYVESRAMKHLFLLMLCIAGAMLTQYLFIYFVVAYAGYALFINRDAKLMAHIVGVIVLALIIVIVIHPGIFNQFALQQERAQSFIVSELPQRVGKVLLAFSGLVLPIMSMKSFFAGLPKIVVLLFLIGVFVFVVVTVFKNRKRISINLEVSSFIPWMVLCSCLLAIVPFMLFLTPYHAMGGQYFVLVYPFLLIALASVVSKYIKAAAAILSLMFVGFILQLVMMRHQQQTYKPLTEAIRNSNLIVVNTVNRRAFLRFVPYLNHQKILLDENAKTENYPANTLFIAEESTKPIDGAITFKKYDLQDGVVLYVGSW